MEKNIGVVIKQIMNIDGENIFLNPKRFNALLDDLAPDLTTERKVFHRAITDETLLMFKELRDKNSDEDEFLLLKIKKKLEDDYGLSESWSILLVTSFADAFEITHGFAELAEPKQSELSPSDANGSLNFPDDLKAEHKNSGLLKRKELLLKEKSSLGLFSLKRKSEIEKQLSEIDIELSHKETEETTNTSFKGSSGILITKIETFASDGTTNGRVLKSNSFFRGETRYVGVKVFFKPNPKIHIANLTWRIYKDNGVPFTNEIKASIPIASNESSVFQQWGWSTPGNWEVGRYRIVASINGCSPVQTYFEIINGSFDIFPVTINNVKLFNGDTTAPPLEQREYTNVFYRNLAKYIYFQLEFSQPGRNLITTFDYCIKDENGNVVVNETYSAEIKYNYGVWWYGYGWQVPGNWKTGKYTYSVSLGKSQPFIGSFAVIN